MYPVEGSDGVTREFNQSDIMQLAQMGLNSAIEKPESEPEPEKVEEPTVQSLNSKLDKANEDFAIYKADKEKEVQLHQYKVNLETAVDGLDLVKEYPSQRNSIMTQSAVLMSSKKITANEAVTTVAKEKLDFIKEVEKNKKHANTKIGAIVDQVQQGGEAPALVLDEPRKMESVTSGRSRRELEDLLRSFSRET